MTFRLPSDPVEENIKNTANTLNAYQALCAGIRAGLIAAVRQSQAGVASALVKTYIEEGLDEVVNKLTISDLRQTHLLAPVGSIERLRNEVFTVFDNQVETWAAVLESADLPALQKIVEEFNKYSSSKITRVLWDDDNQQKVNHGNIQILFDFDRNSTDLVEVLRSDLIGRLRQIKALFLEASAARIQELQDKQATATPTADAENS